MTIYGTDALGAKHFEKALLKAFEPGDALGVFLTTFGDASKTIERLAKKQPSHFVIHLAPFDYSHKYSISANKEIVKKGSLFVERLAIANPNTRFFISPFCEHNHKAKVMEPVLDQVIQLAPHCFPLNSIWKGEQIPGIATEIHLTSSKKLPKKPKGVYTVAFDGFGGDGEGDFCDADIPSIIAHYSDALHIRWWDFQCNGKSSHKDKTPIKDRKEWPNAEYLLQRRATLKVREGALTWKAPNLYKAAADDHPGDPAGKDNRALAILQVKKDEVKVKDSKGKVIDVMRRFDPPLPKVPGGKIYGYRYYSKKYANQLGDLAQERTGSCLISIDDSPLTDADLRSNDFA